MENPGTVAGAFAVDTEALQALGVVDPYSARSMELYASGELTSEERLYLGLWGSPQLSTTSFEARKRVVSRGAPVHAAYFILTGQLLALEGGVVHRLGPGSVIGLAESLAGLPYGMDVVSVTNVEARLIPASQITALLPKLGAGLKGLLRSAVVRTLALQTVPETLK